MATGTECMTATIIVAATQSMGMSYKTRMPWPKLKRESGYFESTTTRSTVPGTMNAVIMGYKTWDKTPTKRYPGRINVVITRNPEKVQPRLQGDLRTEPLHVATSLEGAMELLSETYRGSSSSSSDSSFGSDSWLPDLGRVFIIGGAGLCHEALRMPWVDRLLLTRIGADFKADTFFPFEIDGRGNAEWARQSDRAFQDWVGPDAPDGMQIEDGIPWEAYMFTRTASVSVCLNGRK
ncbi:dihydrofolate reductase [Metarhizium robertsii]|uniref:Dihydrofolate reductase n=2 Tax=Metarhizium robertsii TaxID=568076 RepID=E9ESU2_METRA|nr:Dihydrofolate reductase domain protein [Metarhizium robertsii ARSEF 23]EFZ01965.1 Dihydrofolate reductase domain protein [Metarhizium robertsii ARSEF 23]EXV02475.1 dihydrofolate reductase [Metarhizium robertsii]